MDSLDEGSMGLYTYRYAHLRRYSLLDVIRCFAQFIPVVCARAERNRFDRGVPFRPAISNRDQVDQFTQVVFNVCVRRSIE
jgi:hypothetical protein